MNVKDYEHLKFLVNEFDEADDKIDPLETLLREVRAMIKDYESKHKI